MKPAIVFALAFVASAPSLVSAQQIDMATLQKWSAAKTVHYRVEGTYRAWTPVSEKWKAAEGDVTDSLTIEFDMDISSLSVIGKPSFTDGASSVGSMRSALKECPVAQIAGAYEHLTTSDVKGGPGRLEITGVRQYAPTKSPVECPASNALIATPGGAAEIMEAIYMFDPRMLAIGQTGMPNAVVSADHKTVTLTGDGWTWTYTPTLVR